MITELHVDNYRSIGPNTLVELGPLTALVGPNGSGKSNIADALRFCADCMNTSLAHAIAIRQGFRSLRRWSATRPFDVHLGLVARVGAGQGFWGFQLASTRAEDDGYRVKLEFALFREQGTIKADHVAYVSKLFALDEGVAPPPLPPNADVVGFVRTPQATMMLAPSPPPAMVSDTALLFPLLDKGSLTPLADEIRRIAVYSIFPNKLRAPQNPNPTKPMLTDGENWASMLKALDKDAWGGELIAALGRITGDIDDYRVTQAGGFLIPEFRHKVPGASPRKKPRRENERWHGAAQESDGTLRVASILTALFQQPSPALLGFEEPELAVHPGAIPVLFDFLKEASTRSQILLTTHSPDLLDLIPIDDLRVVERRDGVTTVARVEERQRELVKNRLMSTSDILHAEGLHAEGAGDDA